MRRFVETATVAALLLGLTACSSQPAAGGGSGGGIGGGGGGGGGEGGDGGKSPAWADPPSPVCAAPVLDPALGWTSRPIADGTPCGASDCATRKVCRQGACASEPAQDGDACRDGCNAGTCSGGACQSAGGGLRLLWTVTSKPGYVAYAGPMDHDGNLYWVECHECRQGACPNNLDAVCDPAFLSGDPVYQMVSAGERTPYWPASCELVSVDPAGQQRFRVQLDYGEYMGATVAGDLVVLGVRDTLDARRIADGSRAWRADLGEERTPDPRLEFAWLESPVLAGTRIYAHRGFPYGAYAQLYGFDVRDGKQVYFREFTGVGVTNGVTDREGNVYYQSEDASRTHRTVYSMTWDGQPRWHVQASDYDPPQAVAGGVVFGYSGSDWFNAADGTVHPHINNDYLTTDGQRVAIATNRSNVAVYDLAGLDLRYQFPQPALVNGAGWFAIDLLTSGGILVFDGGITPMSGEITISDDAGTTEKCPVSKGFGRGYLAPGRLTMFQNSDWCPINVTVSAFDVPDLAPADGYRDVPWPRIGG